MIESLIILASPFVVKGITSWVKTLGALPVHDYRVSIIRAIVAILALTSAVLAQWLGEGALEAGSIETTLYAVATAGVATWLYLKEKRA